MAPLNPNEIDDNITPKSRDIPEGGYFDSTRAQNPNPSMDETQPIRIQDPNPSMDETQPIRIQDPNPSMDDTQPVRTDRSLEETQPISVSPKSNTDTQNWNSPEELQEAIRKEQEQLRGDSDQAPTQRPNTSERSKKEVQRVKESNYGYNKYAKTPRAHKDLAKDAQIIGRFGKLEEDMKLLRNTIKELREEKEEREKMFNEQMSFMRDMLSTIKRDNSLYEQQSAVLSTMMETLKSLSTKVENLEHSQISGKVETTPTSKPEETSPEPDLKTIETITDDKSQEDGVDEDHLLSEQNLNTIQQALEDLKEEEDITPEEPLTEQVNETPEKIDERPVPAIPGLPHSDQWQYEHPQGIDETTPTVKQQTPTLETEIVERETYTQRQLRIASIIAQLIAQQAQVDISTSSGAVTITFIQEPKAEVPAAIRNLTDLTIRVIFQTETNQNPSEQ